MAMPKLSDSEVWDLATRVTDEFPASSLAAIRIYLRLHPDSEFGVLQLARLLAYHHRWGECLSALESISPWKGSGRDSWIIAWLEIESQRHDYRTALKWARLLVDEFNGSRDGYCRLGDVLEKSGDHAAAEEQYSSAVIAFPDSIEPLCCLASLCISREDYSGALGFLDRALNLDPRNVECVYLRQDVNLAKELQLQFHETT